MPKAGQWGAARIAVSRLRDEIQRDLTDRVPVATIYATHKDKLRGLSLSAFRKQIALLITRPDKQTEARPAVVPSPPTPAIPTPGTPHAGRTSPARTFSHDPEIKPSVHERITGRKSD